MLKEEKLIKTMRSLETDEEKQKQLAKKNDNINQNRAPENAHGSMRTAGITSQELKTIPKVTQNVTKQNLVESGKKSQESLKSIIGHCVNKESDSLIPITKDKHMFKNTDCFHNSYKYKIKQCTVCLKAWPLSLPRVVKKIEFLNTSVQDATVTRNIPKHFQNKITRFLLQCLLNFKDSPK